MNEAVAVEEHQGNGRLGVRAGVFIDHGNGVGEINGVIGFILDDSDDGEDDASDSDDSLL